VLPDGTRVPCERGSVIGAGVLMLRPESLRVGDTATAPDGALKGRVVQSSFLGTRLRVAVETPSSEAPLIVALHGEDPASAPVEDAEVAVWWAPGDAILLPADDH
jgi:hypothetical protein